MSYAKARPQEGYVVVRVVGGDGGHDAWISPKEAKALVREIKQARKAAKAHRRTTIDTREAT